MTIDLITAAPDENDPANIAAQIDLFVTQLKASIHQFNATAAAMNLNSVTGSSVSSVAIGTGSKSFTASTGKSWQPGMWIAVVDSAAPSTNGMYGTVTSYDSGTGALVVNVVYIQGSGTKSSWVISQSSPATQPIGLVLLSTVVASSSATVDLETTFDTAYDEYLINGIAVACAGSTLQCRMKLGGAYISTTTYRYHVAALSSASSAYAGSASDAAAHIQIGPTAPTYVDFSMRIRNPTSTSLKKLIDFIGSSMTATPALQHITGSGTNDATTALTGIRFLLSSGNIASGTFNLYGVRKT